MQRSNQISSQRIWKHWKVLCSKIGERRAGSKEEKKAADYLSTQFENLGLQVQQESFPCTYLKDFKVDFRVQHKGSYRRVDARCLAGAPGLKGAHEAEIVWVEMPEQAARLFHSNIRNKIVFLIGPLPTHVQLHKRLIAQKPLAVVHIDDRLPFSWVKNDGVYPTWVKRHGMHPTITIPYQDAWRFRKDGAKRARIQIRINQIQSESQNVIAEISGRNPQLPVLLLGSHHDSQCCNVGADDNASGDMVLLELATLLHRSRPLRTIRFISFGCEEQLSVGSAHYVKRHRRELDKIGLVLNFDSVSSILGHHHVFCAGKESLLYWLKRELGRSGFDAVYRTDVMPFMDHFPFSAFGIPSVSFERPNMSGGDRWQHHSVHDNLMNVSADEVVRVTHAALHLIKDLCIQSRWNLPRGLNISQKRTTLELARDLYDLT
jgi:aminopeptidase YwaD